MSQTSVNIAEEALDLLRATRERIDHMHVLFSAIIKDKKHGKSLDVEELASLGVYLGADWSSYTDCQVESMQKALDAVGGAA